MNIEKKAARGTQMMIELYEKWLAPLGFTLNTPRDASRRGGHISLCHPEANKIAIALRKYANVIPDYRAPNSIRVAISPLVNSYVEVFDGFQIIRDLVSSRQYEKIEDGQARVT
jgi:kynureninase